MPSREAASRPAGRRLPPWAIAAALASLVAAHAGWTWYRLGEQAQTAADALAGSLSAQLQPADAAWAQVLGQADLPAAREPGREARSVRSLEGLEIVRAGDDLGAAVLRRSALVLASKRPVAQVEVSRSLQPVAVTLAFDGLVAGGLGGLILRLLRRPAPGAPREQDPVRAEPKARPSSADSRALRVLFDGSEDGLFICDAEGRILNCNPRALTMLSAAREAVVGTSIFDCLRPLGASSSDAATPVPARMPLPAGEATVQPQGAGEPFQARLTVHATTGERVPRYVVVARDLTEERRTQRALRNLANYDSLTGLPNRVLFRDRLTHAMDRARRTGRAMALFFLDLDHFKVVNDSLGHEAGDRLLTHVAGVLTGCLRGGDSVGRISDGDPVTLSRLGGDEFTVILEDIGSAEDAALVARRVLDALAVPLRVGDEEVQVSASIGISLYPHDGVDLDGIIRNTDMAMYRSKSLGRNMYTFFSEDLNAAVRARLSLENNLRRALERREFCLHYQPKASLQTGEVTGVEALLRWHCPGRGMVAPDKFISVLEETGLIVQAGAWVIRAACMQLAEWDRQGLPPIAMAVNLSARQLRHSFLVPLVQDTLRETGIAPNRLELELTESLLMEDTEGNRQVLTAFQQLGIRLAIDDFGTGHSSLSYLRRLDVDTLKIDRSFVTQIPHDAEDCAIATAVVALARSLQMKVVAEGVETEAQAQFLRELGCQDMQGWLLSRALPAEELSVWLREQQRLQLMKKQPRRYADPQAAELPSIVIPDVPRSTATIRVDQNAARQPLPALDASAS